MTFNIYLFLNKLTQTNLITNEKTKPHSKPGRKLLGLVLFGIILFVVHSCKKDFKNAQQDETITDPDVKAAQDWYNSSYPVTAASIINNKQAVSSTSNQNADLSQYMHPDWHTTRKYNRLNKDVIEMPVDSGGKFATQLKNSNNKAYADAKNSKTSFLLLKDGTGYSAYLMTIIADSAYLKGDYSKLSRNTYNNRDAGFSGIVLYFTPKGKYVSGSAYKNGHLVTAAASQQIQNVSKTKVNEVQECINWYWCYLVNGEVVNTIYLYSDCSGFTNNPNAPGDGGGSAGPPGPTECPGTNALRPIAVNKVDPNDGSGDDDGGFVAPVTTQCPIPQVEDVKDSLTTPCINGAFQHITSASIRNLITNWYNTNAIGTTSSINIVFNELPMILSNRNDGSGIIDTIPARTIHKSGSNDYIVTLNNGYPSNGNMSSEAWGQIILHELLHIYISDQQASIAASNLDHLYIFKNLINPSRDMLINSFGMSPDDATDLALNGLGDLWQFSDFATLTYNQYGRTQTQINNTKDQYTSGPKGIKCH